MDAPEDPPVSRQSVLDEIRSTLARIGLDPARVEPAAHLVDDLDLDSLDWVDLAMQLEGRLSIDLLDHRFTSLRTIQDVVERVYSALLDQRSTAS